MISNMARFNPRTFLRRKRVISRLIALGFLSEKELAVNGQPVVFHDLKSSNLLKQIAVHGFDSYETELVTLLRGWPFPLSTFFDCGANIGFFSVLVSLSHPEVKVVAVEPFPPNVSYIRKLMEKNGLQVELVDTALSSEKNEAVTMYYPTGSRSSLLSSSASLKNSFKGSGSLFDHIPFRSVEVRTTTLDSLTESIGLPILLKLDCEFLEYQILLGGTKLLANNDVDVIVEIGLADEDKSQVYDLMLDNGFTSYLITHAGLVRENRPLTFPFPSRTNRTIWRNHLFTKKSVSEIKDLSLTSYGHWI